jgi:hypothetical protein
LLHCSKEIEADNISSSGQVEELDIFSKQTEKQER